jgi:predicted ABC-type ATPase
VQKDNLLTESTQSDSNSPETLPPDREKPLLLIVTGASGAGKNTFYQSKLRDSFPIQLKASASPMEQAQSEQQRIRLLREGTSFVFQSSTGELKLVHEARSHDFAVRAIFIGTEHPNLNTARILSRVSRGGLFGPIAQLREEYENGLRELPAVKQAVDELILLDNTAEGRGPRVIAQFVKGKIVKLSRSIPEWAQRSFCKEFAKWLAQERPSPERAR